VRNRIFSRLLLAFLIVIAVPTLTLDVIVRHGWQKSLTDQIQISLEQKAKLLADRLQSSPPDGLQALAKTQSQLGDARVTIIDRSGKVLADSEADPASMENHATRAEFAAALAGKTGSSIRRSETAGAEQLYVAVPYSSGAVRFARSLNAVNQIASQVRSTLLKGSLAALGVAIVLAIFAANSISNRLQRIVEFAKRVEKGDLSARIAEDSGDEIGQVAGSLDRTARHLQSGFEALERSRRELEALLNSMQDPVVAISADRRIQWVNQSLERLLPRAARTGASLVEAIRDPDLLLALEVTLDQGTVAHARSSLVAPGRWFNVTSAPLPGGGAVAVLHDFTEIERVEKTRRDFIANVSHELRTPLTSIQGYTETLLDTTQNGSREFLEIIRKNTLRMARLTEDLLALARVESGEHKLELQPVSVAELLREAIQSYRPLAQAQNVELSQAEAPEAIVRADRDAIQQVFGNLIDNALKYAAAGGKILIGAKATEEQVEFYVRDFGPGIASPHIPRLFERFYRVDKARSREAGGTGLGLAIVKHIVLNHSGRVRAESELGHGATFIFSLPLASPVAEKVS